MGYRAIEAHPLVADHPVRTWDRLPDPKVLESVHAAHCWAGVSTDGRENPLAAPLETPEAYG